MALYRFLLLLVLIAPIATRAASDDGRGIDPNGRPTVTSSSPATDSDEGNGLDPHGVR
jgi:hypothetical protein